MLNLRTAVLEMLSTSDLRTYVLLTLLLFQNIATEQVVNVNVISWLDVHKPCTTNQY